MCSSQASLCSRWQRLVLLAVPSSGKRSHTTHTFCLGIKLKERITRITFSLRLYVVLATHTQLDRLGWENQLSDPSPESKSNQLTHRAAPAGRSLCSYQKEDLHWQKYNITIAFTSNMSPRIFPMEGWIAGCNFCSHCTIQPWHQIQLPLSPLTCQLPPTESPAHLKLPLQQLTRYKWSKIRDGLSIWPRISSISLSINSLNSFKLQFMCFSSSFRICRAENKGCHLESCLFSRNIYWHSSTKYFFYTSLKTAAGIWPSGDKECHCGISPSMLRPQI